MENLMLLTGLFLLLAGIEAAFGGVPWWYVPVLLLAGINLLARGLIRMASRLMKNVTTDQANTVHKIQDDKGPP